MKTQYQKNHLLIHLLAGLVVLPSLASSGCNLQDEWLEEKRSIGDVMPSTLQDLQAVLDNTSVMNINYAQIGLSGADNNYVTDANLGAAPQIERNAYLWAADIFEGATSFDWQYAYRMVAYANIVLEGLDNHQRDANNQTTYDNIKGSALFYRSMGFYQLSQLFCKPYDAANAATDLGIPIRLTSDVNVPSVRATVQETYDQMIGDLLTAVELLPLTPLYTTRPSGVAANALLAKVYLSMEDYANAGIYANLVLQDFNTLLDFNSDLVSEELTYRFPSFQQGNPEVIFYSSVGSKRTLSSLPSGTGYTDQELYTMYDLEDLRKTLFYGELVNGAIKFQGNYTGTNNNFGGIASNEIYLIRAECYARIGNITDAMTDLNTLLYHRYENDGSFYGVNASTADEALAIVLQERRKELPYTGQLRWEDLRRLNKDPRFAVTQQRTYQGQTYTLLPNDNRYVFPIPDLEIQLYGLPQNER